MKQANGVSELLCNPHLAKLTRKPFLFFSLCIVFSCTFPACSVTDFIAAYFNTFYNARRQFREAEDELLAQRENKQNDRPFGYVFSVQSTTKAKFTAVIEKCSKLLQYHPESNLVDDALLMIGKSYYYQNDYQQAERKFKELLEQFPNSDLVPDTKLLMSYNYYMLNDKTKASSVAKSLLEDATSSGEKSYIAKAAVILAQVEVDNKDFGQAKSYYLSAAENAGTSGEQCAAYLSLAGLFSQEGNNQRALDAYRKAESASANYQLIFKARIGQAHMLSKLGAHEESLTVLRNLLSSSNYKEFYGEISLEIGNTFKESKDYPSAIAQYTYVDTAYGRTESSANSYFQLGDLYETRLSQFDSAYISYTKGKSEFPQALVTVQLARRAEYLGKYLQHRNEIQKYDSIRAVILAPRDTTASYRTALVDSTTDSLHTRKDSVLVRIHAPPVMTLDSVNAQLAYHKTELAALLYTMMGLPDSAENWYHRVLVDHPASLQAPRALFTLAQIYSQDTTRSPGTVDSLYREIVNRFPKSEFEPEAKRLLGLPVTVKVPDPAEADYAHAQGLLNAGKPKAAGDALRGIVKGYPSSPVASKAQYALGWIYERVNFQPDSAIANYRKLVALYPTSQYSAIVRPMIDEYDLAKRAEENAKDSTSTAPKDSSSMKPPGKLGSKEKQLDPNKQEDPTSPSKKPKE